MMEKIKTLYGLEIDKELFKTLNQKYPIHTPCTDALSQELIRICSICGNWAKQCRCGFDPIETMLEQLMNE